jgi:transposase
MALRREFARRIAAVDVKRLRFLDEAGVNIAMTRLYGRAPRGERVVDAVPENWGENVSMIGVISSAGVTAAMHVEQAVDGDVFEVFVREVLAPKLSEGDVVVWDNLNVHKNSAARKAIEAAGARIEPLPPYSPDLNPIEKMWSKLKSKLRAKGARTVEALEAAISEAFTAVTPGDAEGWFKSCGYQLGGGQAATPAECTSRV